MIGNHQSRFVAVRVLPTIGRGCLQQVLVGSQHASTTTNTTNSTPYRGFASSRTHPNLQPLKSSRHTSVQHTAPTFRATKVFYTGDIEANVNVKSSELLQTSKIHARDLFDLHLTSRQERRRQQLSTHKKSSSKSPQGSSNNNNNNTHAQRGPVRQALAAILPRSTSIVLSFAQIRAVVGRHFVLFLEAHDPAVQEFAHELAGRFSAMRFSNHICWW